MVVVTLRPVLYQTGSSNNWKLVKVAEKLAPLEGFPKLGNADQYYERSDHYNYAQKGIPVLMLSTGFHEDYHKVSDEPAKIDYPKMARIGTLMLEFGITLANREARPR